MDHRKMISKLKIRGREKMKWGWRQMKKEERN